MCGGRVLGPDWVQIYSVFNQSWDLGLESRLYGYWVFSSVNRDDDSSLLPRVDEVS